MRSALRVFPLLCIVLMLVACGTTVKTGAAAPAKKTVMVTLKAGEQLNLGGYAVAVQRLAPQVEFTVNGKPLVLSSGGSATLDDAMVEVTVQKDVALIRITER